MASLESELVDSFRAIVHDREGYAKEEYIRRNVMLAEAVLPTGGWVLDLGCGRGYLARVLAARGLRVVGSDVTLSRLVDEYARAHARLGGSLDYVLAHAERTLPFRDGTFSAVVASEVLEHLNAPASLFHEASRLLCGGGRLVLTTPNVDALPYLLFAPLPPETLHTVARFLGLPLHLHPEFCGAPVDATNPDAHKREGFTRRELASMAGPHGLRLRSWKPYRVPLPDALMSRLPRAWTASIASMGAKEFPAGLENFALYAKVGGCTHA